MKWKGKYELECNVAERWKRGLEVTASFIVDVVFCNGSGFIFFKKM